MSSGREQKYSTNKIQERLGKTCFEDSTTQSADKAMDHEKPIYTEKIAEREMAEIP